MNAITGASSPDLIDNDINTGIKQPLLDILGIPDNTNISAAGLNFVAAGLDRVIFQDAAVDPASAGRLQRNGADLLFHDGTAARALVGKATTQTLTNKTLTAPTISAPVLSGTATGTYTLAGTPTITAPTISAPTFSGTAAGSLTNLALTTPTLTTPAITNGVLTTSTVAADPTAALGIVSKQYVDKTVASYTSNNTLASGVGLALLSGAGFVMTLPAAASHTNREVTFIHRGTSLTNFYTITGNAAETIIGPDSTANTYILYTKGEEVRLKCDGTSWYVISHRAVTNWVDAGPMTIAATSVDPTKPTTPDLDNVYWRRDGSTVFLRYILQISSATGGVAGTGAYLFALPTNIAFDTTVVTPVGSAYATSLMSEAVSSALPGMSVCVIDSTATDPFQLYAYDTTHFQAARTVTVAVVGSAAYALTNAEMGYYFELSARAANWRL